MSYSPFPAAYTTTGSATPSSTLQVGGSDGTDLRVLLTSTTGQVHVLADNQPSFAFDSASNLLVNTQGYDGAQFHSLRTDTSGRLRVVVDHSSMADYWDDREAPLLVEVDHSILVAYPVTGITPPTGQAVIVATGTAVPIGISSFTQGVILSARTVNSASLWLGGATVLNAFGGTADAGYELPPGVSVTLPVAQAALLWINGTAADGLSWIGV